MITLNNYPIIRLAVEPITATQIAKNLIIEKPNRNKTIILEKDGKILGTIIDIVV